jgi:hypothetical protein
MQLFTESLESNPQNDVFFQYPDEQQLEPLREFQHLMQAQGVQVPDTHVDRLELMTIQSIEEGVQLVVRILRLNK